MNKIAIVLPDVMGSELRLGTELVWPGLTADFVLPYRRMAGLLDPNLVPTDLIRRLSFSDQYRGLLDDLALCGFREDDQTLFVCPYDWRKSLVLAAELLADKVEAACAAHDGQAEITLIAHGMGGLVSRCYLESRDFDHRPGFAAVRWLLSIGTPHRGIPVALTAALGLERCLFLAAKQVQELINDERYPGFYQLLPPRGEPFVWNSKPDAAFSPMDIYDPEVATALVLSAASLEAAQHLQARLDIQRRPDHVRYFFFAGNSQKTLSAVHLQLRGGNQYVDRIHSGYSGDGTVPVWSARITGVQGQTVGGEHSAIYRDNDFRRVLCSLIGEAGALGVMADSVQVTLGDQVCEPQALISVTLGLSRPACNVQGEVRFERVAIDDRDEIDSAEVVGEPLRICFEVPRQFSWVKGWG